MASGSNSGSDSYAATFHKIIHVKGDEPIFFCLYLHISLKDPIIKDHFPLWTVTQNPDIGMCKICHVFIETHLNPVIFKAAILRHINSIQHQQGLKKTNVRHNVIFSTRRVSNTVVKGFVENSKDQIFMSKEIEGPHANETAADKHDQLKDIVSHLCQEEANVSDTCAKTVHDSLKTGFSVTEASSQFITKNASDENLSCTLCNVVILFAPNPNELKYNVWSHIHGDSHKSKLPGNARASEKFKLEKHHLFKIICQDKDDEQYYFKFGPHPFLVKCDLCNVAVSTNINRWENHIFGKDHIDMKNPKVFNERPPLSSQIVLEFTQLMSQVETKLEQYTSGIQAGVLPGYVVCVDCCSMVLSTKLYLESHLQLTTHIRNCLVRPVIPAKVTVQNLVRKLPAEVSDRAFFVKIPCGLKCSICRFVCPATTYDMYIHIVGAKH